MGKFESFLKNLNVYLKLSSPPVAVKMLRKGVKPPVPAKSPLKDYKKRFVLCQPGEPIILDKLQGLELNKGDVDG